MRHMCSSEVNTLAEKQILLKRNCCPKIDLTDKRECVVHHIKSFQRERPAAPRQLTPEQRQKMATDMGDLVCAKLAARESSETPEEVGESEEIWEEHGEELRSCCAQEGEARYACFRRTFLEKANRVCSQEEALPPFFPEHQARNILAECCAGVGHDRVECFGEHRYRYMQARKNRQSPRLVIDPETDRTTPEHLDRLICERFQQPPSVRTSRHRHRPNTKNRLRSCCAMSEEQRHGCLQQIMVSRVDSLCSREDELPGYMPRSLRRMLIQNCCQDTGVNRVTCFGFAHHYEHNGSHLPHSHAWHEHSHESHEHTGAGHDSHGSNQGHQHNMNQRRRHHHQHIVSFEDALCRISHHRRHHHSHESTEEVPQGALAACCEQSGEARKECINSLRRQRADRVCAEEEELPAWHFSGEESALIRDTCCAEEGNERYACFNNTLQGKREEVQAKKMQFYTERLAHRQRVKAARMCNHLNHDHDHSRHTEARLIGVPPQKREHMRQVWEQRRADMSVCCELEGVQRMDCIRTMRQDRIDRVCELGEPLVMTHISGKWNNVHPVASNCCLADGKRRRLPGEERYHCFNESLIKGEMKHSRWHLNWNGHTVHEEHHAHSGTHNMAEGHSMLRRCCETGMNFARDNRFTTENSQSRCSSGAISYIEFEENCPRCQRFFTRCCVKAVAISRSSSNK
ncbi:hypothetical protein CAPTEDRAFT_221065 [Capitella teleta]|uniref:Uncharacterized protein n=1 Tax=Capitella teleta TaxID=283909 RepID=R7UAS5_CAPTE|nr:hypothetical protein CAPTEDRAFT_221065 [Capitella teleta]|eukprot:ELU03084.1 hypothetical protein CAPTEDRAFT_221065 [Capitella teleta]